MTPPADNDVSHDGQAAATEFEQHRAQGKPWCDAGLEEVKRNLLATGYPAERLKFVRGKVEDTLPASLPARSRCCGWTRTGMNPRGMSCGIFFRAFLNRPIEGDWPYSWIDATYVKVREAGRIVSMTVTISVAVDTEGMREVIGMAVGASESEPFLDELPEFADASWAAWGEAGPRRRPQGPEGDLPTLPAHIMRNALANVPKGQHQMVEALIRTVFAQDTEAEVRRQWRAVADQLRERFPKIGALMDTSEADVLSHLSFPKARRLQIHSTKPLERLNAEIKRRTDVVGHFPNKAAIVRLVGALLLDQNDEWQLQRRYLRLEGLQALGDNQPARLSAVMS